MAGRVGQVHRGDLLIGDGEAIGGEDGSAPGHSRRGRSRTRRILHQGDHRALREGPVVSGACTDSDLHRGCAGHPVTVEGSGSGPSCEGAGIRGQGVVDPHIEGCSRSDVRQRPALEELRDLESAESGLHIDDDVTCRQVVPRPAGLDTEALDGHRVGVLHALLGITGGDIGVDAQGVVRLRGEGARHGDRRLGPVLTERHIETEILSRRIVNSSFGVAQRHSGSALARGGLAEEILRHVGGKRLSGTDLLLENHC